MESSLEWIILVTTNYEESKKFYQQILGLPIVREITHEQFAQFKLQNCFLAIYGKPFVESLVGEKYIGTPGSAIYTFSQVKDLDEEYENLQEKGVHFIKEPSTQAWGQRTAYFTDPDGHIWEIQQWVN